MNLSNQIDKIEQKVRQLAAMMEDFRQQNVALFDENTQLKTELKSEREKAGELITKLTQTQRALEVKRKEEPESTKKLRKQMDQYILEIDDCIEWLQNA